MNIDLPNNQSRRRGRLITVLDKMIVTDLFKTVLSVLFVVVIIIVSRKFIRILAKAVDGSLSVDAVMNMLGYKFISVSVMFFPAAVFMAVIMVLGRMYRDQEMAAIASAGGGPGVIYKAVFLLMIPLAFAAGGLSLVAAPWAEKQTQKLVVRDQGVIDIKGITAGRFSELKNGSLVFYVEDIVKNNQMQNIFMQMGKDMPIAVVTSDSGKFEHQQGGLYLILKQGERVKGTPGKKSFVMESFAEYGILIEQQTKELSLRERALSTEKLWQSHQKKDLAEIQNRLSVPLGVLFLAFLAVPLAKMNPRGGVYGNLLFAFGVYFIYSNMKRVGQSWVIKGVIPVWFGYIWIYLILFLMGIILLIRIYGWKWVKEQLIK